MINFKYLDLPSVPPELLDSEEYIINGPDAFSGKRQGYGYKSVSLNENLLDWCIDNIIIPLCDGNQKLIFKHKSVFKKVFTYHVIDSRIGPHIDKGRTITLNYILRSGNKNLLPSIVFYDDLTTLNIVEKIQIEAHRWHYIKVATPHNVINIEKNEYRLAITVNYDGIILLNKF